MTVEAAVSKAGPYTGNGVTTDFPFSFKVFVAADLRVVHTSTAGIEDDLVLNTGYLVALNPDQDASPGGIVQFAVTGVVTALPAGEKLTAVCNMDYDQSTDITNGGGFYPQVIEDVVDRVTILAKQLLERLTRGLVVSVSDTSAPGDLPTATARANMFLAFDGSGNPVASAGGGSSPVSAAMAPVVSAANLGAARVAMDVLQDVFTTRGDLVRAGVGGVGERVALGTNGQVLSSNGTDALWATPTSNSAALVGSGTPFVGMINGTIVTSRAGNAETWAIKTLAGADPSAADPVIFVFRDSAVTTGAYVFLKATAALSVTASSGSTLGASNGVPFRAWLVVFNDAGTLRLGVINTCHATNTVTYYFDTGGLLSSTAEGGAGAADSDRIVYTGTAVATKSFAIVGYTEYTLAAAGTWGTAPSKIRLFGPGVPLPGEEVQSALAQSSTAANVGTSAFPADDTTPQVGEGNAISALSATLAPSSAINYLDILATVIAGQGSGSAASMHLGIFQDATANALAARAIQTAAGTGAACEVTLVKRIVAGTVAATTLSVRGGFTGGIAMWLNGFNGASFFGGMTSSNFVREIMR